MAYMASSLPVMSPSYNNLPPQQQIYAGMPRGHQTPTMAPPPSIPNPQRQQPQQMQFQPARTLVFDKPTKKQRRTSSGSMGDDAMPEWMEGGPVDVDDTVELRGFDKSDDGKRFWDLGWPELIVYLFQGVPQLPATSSHSRHLPCCVNCLPVLRRTRTTPQW